MAGLEPIITPSDLEELNALTALQLEQTDGDGEIEARKVAVCARALGLEHASNNARSEIIVDFCHGILGFCQESGFRDEQTVAFFAVMKRVFDADPTEAFAVFKNLILEMSVVSDSGEEAIFSPADVKKTSAFVSRTLMRNIKAYSYVLRHPQEVELEERLVEVEVAMPMEPLCVTKEVFVSEETPVVFDE